MNPIQFNSTKPNRPSVSNGNFYIGTVGDYGPSNVSGFYTGLTPPSGQYSVYVGNAPTATTVRLFPNKDELIGYLKLQGFRARPGREFPQLLQTASFTNDICVINKDIEPIYAGNKLNFHFDAGFTPCYASGSEHIYTLNDSLIVGELFPANSSGSRYSEDNGGYIDFQSSRSERINTNYTQPVAFRSPFSLNFWVYLSGSQGTDTRLFSKDYQVGSDGFEVGIDGNKIFITVAGNTNTFDRIGDPTPTLNDWNFISISCNSNTDFLSINGSSTISKSRIGIGSNITDITSNRSVILGSYRGSSNFLNGGIAIVSMYTEVLKFEAILQNYNACASRFGLPPK